MKLIPWLVIYALFHYTGAWDGTPVQPVTPVTYAPYVPFENVRLTPLKVKCYAESTESNCVTPLPRYCGISRCPKQP